ncbi:STAS domain-containing protein [Pseudonocardia sichuanensis]|uniref:Anti-anti-sigma factor n=1 Tax=Pseudonocardia kunmingensis TaxID=630975 RepID=A0A543CXE6_9PSEU|nr:STAS domain-containing protein [Pseudonocardia kunmingensis]TQM01787.1 anti-anti-sigma factor [Pseudonocardia kunmingensis]
MLTTAPQPVAAPEPDQLEVRLHSPTPEVVLMRVNGDLDVTTARALAARAGQQLLRAPHLVIDLTDVRFLGIRGLDTLRALHEQATATGTQVHLAAPHHAVRRPLRLSGLDQLLPTDSSAEMILARLATPHWPCSTTLPAR